jgi:hypothetical protein
MREWKQDSFVGHLLAFLLLLSSTVGKSFIVAVISASHIQFTLRSFKAIYQRSSSQHSNARAKFTWGYSEILNNSLF